MKFILVLCAVLFVASFVNAGPLEQDAEGNAIVSRQRRATCDLLSLGTKWVTLNDSACAAHCLVLGKGFKGGHCQKGVCHCRK